MVDKINTQNSWRQITSASRVKKVKPRPDYNRDKRSNQNGQRSSYRKDKGSGKPPKTDLPNGEAPNDFEKKETADLGGDNADKQKSRTGRTHGKLIDIVV
jgi:hypothetical protein